MVTAMGEPVLDDVPTFGSGRRRGEAPASSQDAATQMALEFQRLSEFLSQDGDHAKALRRLVDLAVHLVPGCEWAGVTEAPRGKPPFSLISTDPVAQGVDELQYSAGEGPCLYSAEEQDVACIPDIAVESRWPAFAKRVLEESPVRSVLSFRLGHHPAPAALNLYGDQVGCFDDDAIALGALFATHANTLLVQLDAEDKATHLTEALTTSRLIGSAVGIVMMSHKVDSETAFDILRRTSQDLNIKLRDLADDVASTGAIPERRR